MFQEPFMGELVFRMSYIQMEKQRHTERLLKTSNIFLANHKTI